MSIEKMRYTATAPLTSGRDGRSTSSDLVLGVHLSMPRALGGAGDACTHPALATRVASIDGGWRASAVPRPGALARWQERRAKELLAANLSGRITLEELARSCELSVRHFTRAFRGSTGMSAHAWLLELRVDRAKDLLANSRRPLIDVALDCGFADQSHMTRVFQRAVGLTPKAWRRLHQRRVC